MKRALVALVALTGCSDLSYTVPRAAVRELPIERKLKLFDAENDLYIALDEAEALERNLQALREQRQRARHQRENAEGDGERAEKRHDAHGVEVAELAIDVLGLKLDYLDEERGLARERLEVQDDLVIVARAKLELAKAQEAKEANVVGSEDIDLADFTAQVDDCSARARAAQEALAEREKEVAEVKARWLAERQKLEKASGGGLGNPWVEEVSLWGE